ncbi:sigma factor G inhibitor Gin [Neobacillus mesonae]|uniref:Sigma factor G inhibitor Gin n=1 Tax=Neobacillus mesonae TaxID=1193713 RepID=A0A3T0I650_9BACI|nr:sigma factor G inhibitor Gin [Neobacillus mesonae]AZU64790.1 sigma factor G inhibitor Gin [Neobacillus mesonae]MED4204755.1 sigma factor G inhibitor Gin [Neobacillus mesonae]
MEVENLSSNLAHNHFEETCVICENQKVKGIHLYTSFICSDCEHELIQTDTSDPKYKYFLKRLRKVTTPEIFS